MIDTVKAQDRVIRVFVSSTFRDMQAERDELVLKVFPQLRRLCEVRGVTWGEIDLRWGITEEQSQRGEVLPICLEEIRRCRPYFIGLLGERYGWIPDAIPAKVLEQEPWINGHSEGADKKSVTELEILHGVLNNPEMADHAFFYFRAPAFVDTLPDQKKVDFVSENAESHQKLNQLKDNIRQQYRERKLKYAPREEYVDAKVLGEMVLADFTALIDALYPQGREPSPRERERMDHEAYAHSRAGVYVGRQEYFDRLDSHVASDAGPLVVLGESGGGKSALLANWALRYREKRPHDFLLLHFIGASPDSANAVGLLRRLMLELKEHFDLPDEVPTQAEKTREEFPNWLTKIAGKGAIVLVLDSLNQLEDVDSALDLGWLPHVFPKYCRVIVATLPGRSLTAIEQRGWLQSTPPLIVHPLDEPERRQLIHDFLKQYTRNLGSARTDLVARAPQTANPLYLRVLLNELRVFGLFEQLSERIKWYLEANDPYALYRKVIIRWEESYEDDSDIVGDTLSLLWAARHGLSEVELLEAMGSPERPLPRNDWSPLFLAMSDSLVSRSGLLTFAHDFLRFAARDAYLPTEMHQQRSHHNLASNFQRQSAWTNRKLEELPWQLAAARDWQHLHEALTEQACFLGVFSRNEYELSSYWRRLKPQFDLAVSYKSAFDRWTRDQSATPELAHVANELGRFLLFSSCLSECESLFRYALSIDEQFHGTQHPTVSRDLGNLASLLFKTDRPEEAEVLMRRALAIDEVSFGLQHPNVTLDLNNLAWLLRMMNRLSEAEPLIRRALAIDEHLHGTTHPVVARDLTGFAQLLHDESRLDEAEPLMRRALAINEQFYGADHPEIAVALNNLAALLQDTNRLAEAEQLFRRALAIEENAYGPEHPTVATCLSNLALLLKCTNHLSVALPLMRRSLAITEKAYGVEHTAVADSIGNLASLLCDLNRHAEAEPLMRRGLAIHEKCSGPNHPKVAIDLSNLATLLKRGNQLIEAEQCASRALAIDEGSHGSGHPNVAIRLAVLADILLDLNRPSEAEPLIRRTVEIFLEFKNRTKHEHPYFRAAFDNYVATLEMAGLTDAEIHQQVRALIDRCT